MDPLDVRIVEALQRDGQLTNVQLAERVHSTPSTCLRRVQRLKQRGILARAIHLADPAKLGRGLRAIISVTTRDQTRADRALLAAMLRREPAITLAYGVTGDVDTILIGNFRDMDDYQTACNRLFDGLDSVVRYTTHFIAEVYKEDLTIPCDAVAGGQPERAAGPQVL